MHHYNLNTQQQLVELQRREAMRRADSQRRIDELQGNNNPLRPALARLGSALSTAGDNLQRRYGEQDHHATDNAFGLESA